MGGGRRQKTPAKRVFCCRRITMFGSRWGAISALGLITWIGGTILIVVLAIGVIHCLNSRCYEGRTAGMLRTIAEYIVPLGAGPDTTSSVELDDTRGNPHYYERQDLRAQESVARTTNALVRLTCITIFLGAMGTVLLIWTLRANTRAAEAATEANRIARLDMRAWVTVRWEVPCEVKERLKNLLILA